MSVDTSLPVFRARGLGKIYRAGDVAVQALQSVDLDIAGGEFVVLLGPSGSGKSTLLNILGGLEVASSGSLNYLDHDLIAADDEALTRYRREHVGFVFQFYNLIPSLTAYENVALVTDIVAHPMSIDEALERVALTARRDHFPSQL
ncbi:MAG TPA: ATP-binding cassette domain-containing protein, partial [Albitalea sp.]|nr:ATP-binding cassette domain-containing protein [Albitalea sp.]